MMGRCCLVKTIFIENYWSTMEEGKIVKFQVLDGRENQITIIIIIIENDDVQMFRKGHFRFPLISFPIVNVSLLLEVFYRHHSAPKRNSIFSFIFWVSANCIFKLVILSCKLCVQKFFVDVIKFQLVVNHVDSNEVKNFANQM